MLSTLYCRHLSAYFSHKKSWSNVARLSGSRKGGIIETAPSNTTTVLLRRLPPTLTESSLKDHLKDISFRRLELQPGFTVHVTNPAAASTISQYLAKTFDCQSKILPSSIPSILIRNLPEIVSSSTLVELFQQYDPKLVTLTGSSTLQIVVESAETTLKVMDLITTIRVNDQFLETNVSELTQNTFVIQVVNADRGNDKEIENAIKSTIPPDLSTKLKFVYEKPKSPSAIIRVHKDSLSTMKQTLQSLRVNEKSLIISEATPSSYHSLFIRRTDGLNDSQLRSLLGNFQPTRIVMNKKAEFVRDDLVIAYFDSENLALTALKSLKDSTFEGKRLSVTYREAQEPELLVLTSLTDKELREKLKHVAVSRIQTEHSKDPNNPKKFRIAFPHFNAFNQAKTLLISDIVEQAGYSPYFNVSVELPVGAHLSDEAFYKLLVDAMSDEKLKTATVKINSFRQAFISFIDSKTAHEAYRATVSGKIKVPSNPVLGSLESKLSSQPAYAVESINYPVDKPLADALKAVEDSNSSIRKYYLTSDRVATVKFKRHMNVVPGMKLLKKIEIDGKKLIVERYRSDVVEPETEYDHRTLEDEFDRLSLRSVMEDYLNAEPATRYQIAKNMFERALNDVKGDTTLKDAAGYLLSNSVNPALTAEVSKLLSQKTLSSNDKNRLFELYLQRDDMMNFLSDYQDFVAAFGPPNDEDPFNWTQFNIEYEEDLKTLQAAMKNREDHLAADPKLILKDSRTAADYLTDANTIQKPSDEDSLENNLKLPDKSKFPNEFRVEGEQGRSEEVISLLDPENLIDRDGRPWSGVILDNDTTQKTLPGNRVMSHRALVMIGNLRGVGGFGMGKAATADKAVEGAFRDALRNLTFIDLYENSGLAHDLHGKHNSCHCYIRATPTSRMMIAGPFAEAILVRFGISSASVRFFGRRTPYSMTRAMFDALSRHENLDEYAKDRGLRYLTLKWAYKNNI